MASTKAELTDRAERIAKLNKAHNLGLPKHLHRETSVDKIRQRLAREERARERGLDGPPPVVVSQDTPAVRRTAV